MDRRMEQFRSGRRPPPEPPPTDEPEEPQDHHVLRLPLPQARRLVLERYEPPASYPAIFPSDLPQNICMRCGWELTTSENMVIAGMAVTVPEEGNYRYQPGTYRICVSCLLDSMEVGYFFGQMQQPLPRLNIYEEGEEPDAHPGG
jgi:hypothetical protein